MSDRQLSLTLPMNLCLLLVICPWEDLPLYWGTGSGSWSGVTGNSYHTA